MNWGEDIAFLVMKNAISYVLEEYQNLTRQTFEKYQPKMKYYEVLRSFCVEKDKYTSLDAATFVRN